jgi:single-strand DNA-binding protein
VQRRFANAQGVREADFLTVVCWRQLAELCAKYLEKGHKCAVVGSIQTRSYDAQDGSKKIITEIIADEVEFLTERKEAANGHSETPAGFEEVPDSDLPF